jgi:hypothetical protein
MNLFVSTNAATDFQAGYPHVANVPVAEVFDVMAPVFDAVDRVRGAGVGAQPSGPSAPPRRVVGQRAPADLKAIPGARRAG